MRVSLLALTRGARASMEENAREGELRGEQRGEQRGVQKGEAQVLLRQMRLKFGEIPEDVRRRIEQADADTLLAWSERILTAERIEEVTT